jgi:glycerate kinase
MIRDAISRGAQKIFLGIGGSATNDAGTGMATALGYKFLDRNGNELEPVGENLELIHSIDDSDLFFDPSVIEVQVACDVDNPLYGKDGAAFTYSPQKGATPEMVKKLDKGLRNFATIVTDKYGKDISQLPGAGAAGGLGAGAVVFLNARLVSGIKLVMDITKFEDQLKTTGLVITGEGKIDDQTFQGKVIDGVTSLAKKNKIPVLAVCGDLKIDARELKSHGIIAVQSLVSYYGSIDKAMKNPRAGIREVTQILLGDFSN